MVNGLTDQKAREKQKRKPPTNERDRLRKEQRAMEALTKALLDPCTTVQEAVLDSLLQRAVMDNVSPVEKDRLPE